MTPTYTLFKPIYPYTIYTNTHTHIHIYTYTHIHIGDVNGDGLADVIAGMYHNNIHNYTD
jgi:hypothetical protein